MWFDKYDLKDFIMAVQEFHTITVDNLDYDKIIEIATKLLDGMVLDDMKQYRFEEAVLATFANGLVIGLLTAEQKIRKPLKPLIEH
jgi:hypothetical protein